MSSGSQIHQIRLSPAGIPRLYMLTNLLNTSALDSDAYDALFEALDCDKDCLVLLTKFTTADPYSTPEQKYSLLLSGMSRFTQSRYALSSSSAPIACIAALAHGIADTFDADSPSGSHLDPDGHPFVRAMYLARRSAFTFVERIESRLAQGVDASYFTAVEPFLTAALLADDSLARSIRGMIARVGTNGLVSSDVIVPFMVNQILVPCDATSTDGADELSEAMRDVVEVLCASKASNDTISLTIDALFERFQRSQGVNMALRCLSFFLGELSPTMILPLAVRGMQLGEDRDANACFDLVTALLSINSDLDCSTKSANSSDSMSSAGVDALSLATLECVCLRSSFYCQPNSTVKGAVQACLTRCRSMMAARRMCSWGPPDDVFFQLELQAVRTDVYGRPTDTRNNGDMDAAIAQVLAHLAHGSISVRLEALDVVRRMVRSPGAASERICFFALPVILHAIRKAVRSSQLNWSNQWNRSDPPTSPNIREAFYVRELLFTLASLGAAKSTVPFIARTLQSLLTDGAPQELVGIAIRLLGQLFFLSRKAYASLKMVLLGCDMKREAVEDLTIEQRSAMHTLVDVCERAPEKGKDFVHMIHTCASSPHPILAASGLKCIRLLCSAGILDFEKAWVVIGKVHSDLPEHNELAAAWVELIGCALLEDDLNSLNEISDGESGDQSPRATMLASVIELVWAAADHPSPLVRSKAYDALAAIDWDVAEAVDCLRPPAAYARLLEAETDTTALVSLESMLEVTLNMEHADRRKQLLELQAQIPVQVQQSHRQRFHKLTQTIPRVLLKENSLLGSGAFVALNLKTRDYAKTAKELCSPTMAAPVDLLVIPEYIPLLVDAWKNFLQRWTRAGVVNSASGSVAGNVDSAWNELGLDAYTSASTSLSLPQLSNPNILAAMLACATLQPALAKPVVETYERILDDPLQHRSIINVCIILAAISTDLARKHVSTTAADSLRATVLRAMADAAGFDDHRLLACAILDVEVPDAYLDDPTSVRATCDRLRSIHAVDPARTADTLCELLAMSMSNTEVANSAYPLLAAARLLTIALSHGTPTDPTTQATLTGRLMAMLTTTIHGGPHTRPNAAYAALALDLLFQHTLKNPKNHDESVADDNAIESQLETICKLPVADPRRMAAIPIIADMSARATHALEQDGVGSFVDTPSLDRLSTSAIGHLTDALRVERLANSTLTARQIRVILSVLSKTSRVSAGRDWSASLRRCVGLASIQESEKDDDCQEDESQAHPYGKFYAAIVAFAARHAQDCAGFITEDVFNAFNCNGPPNQHDQRGKLWRAALSEFDKLSAVLHGDALTQCVVDAGRSVGTASEAAALATALRRLLDSFETSGRIRPGVSDSIIKDVLVNLRATHCCSCPEDWKTIAATTSADALEKTRSPVNSETVDKMKLCCVCAV